MATPGKILGIDASNIRGGGGLTHLVELLNAADPAAFGFGAVWLWAGESALARVSNQPWLKKAPDRALDRAMPFRVHWQHFRLPKLLKASGCDLLFVPGGSDGSGFHPQVTMNRNLLPFEHHEAMRYGWGWMRLKLRILRTKQTRTYKRADGIIFLTDFAKKKVVKVSGPFDTFTATIPHGVDRRFYMPPRPTRSPSEFTQENPCRLIYVSTVDVYKHQWVVAEAVSRLKVMGHSVVLDLIGPPAEGMSRLQRTLDRLDPAGTFLRYRGAMPHEKIHAAYHAADIGIFASSCETFGQILTESMSAGLPIACSSRSAMPELLGSAGVYFDPEDVVSLQSAIEKLMEDPELRQNLAAKAYEKAQEFSWERCARETFAFLAKVIRDNETAMGLDRSNPQNRVLGSP